MISHLDPASQRFLTDLNRIQARASAAQQQVSSGLKVQSASDSPDQIGTLLQLEAERSANKQTLTNLTRVQAEVNAADNVLTTAVQLLDRITQLTGQGLSEATAQGLNTQTAQGRANYARQIRDLQEQIVSLTSTTVEGRYIFDGGDGSGPPYEFDATAPNGAVRLRSTPASRQVQDASGASFEFALSAQQIFDPRDSSDNAVAGNIFAAVQAAITALNANDTAAINTAIDDLHLSSDFLGGQQSFYGTVQNRLINSTNTSELRDVSLKSQIGAIRDADLIAASLEITQSNTELQAALAAQSKTQTRSLFDYLA